MKLWILCLIVAGSAWSQSAPPFPNKLGSNLATNPTFATSLTGWNPQNGCVTWDGTTTHTADGSGSAKLTACNATAVLESRTLNVSGHENLIVKFWIKTDGTFAGTVTVNPYDANHGGFFAPVALGRTYLQVGQSSDWVQVAADFTIGKAHQADTNWTVDIGITSGAGNAWIDDVTIAAEWFPIRSFLIYPNNGYLWNDKTPPKRYSPGVNPALGQIDGVSEIDCSGCSLAVKLATVAGCGSGVLATDSIATPTATQYWQFTPAQYGTLSVGTKYYICSSLSGTYTDAYSDWPFTYQNATFRNGLQSYIDVDGAWVFEGVRKLPLGAYDSLGGNDTGSASPNWALGTSCSPNESSAKNCYLKHIMAPECTNGAWPVVASGISGLSLTACNNNPGVQRIYWYGQIGLDAMMSDIPGMSSISPCGSCTQGDQLSPWLDAITTQNIAHFQELNYLFGTVVGGGASQSQPAFAPSIVTGSGSITANFLFIEITEVAYQNGQGGGGQPATRNETKPSSVTTVNLSTAGCAGTNCSAQFSLPACDSTRGTGFYIYTATNSTNSVPAQSTFRRQYAGGVFTGVQETPCSASVTLSSLLASGIAPPSTDTTIVQFPSWASGASLSDQQSYTDFYNTMTNASHAGGAGFYIEDEPGVQSIYNASYVDATVRTNGMLTWCAEFNSYDAQLWRDLCDITTADPYAYGFSGGVENYAASPISANSETCTNYNGNGPAGVACRPEIVDLWTRELSLDTYGSRPLFQVLELYQAVGALTGLTYANHYQQALKALIACKDIGSAGCGTIFWNLGLNAGGLETTFFGNGNTITPLAIGDFTTATNQLSSMSSVLLSTVTDSSYLNGGSGQVDGANGETVTNGVILSNVKMGSAVSSVCGGTSIYASASNYPFGAARFFTVTDANSNQWIFVTNLCTTSYTGTFTLVAPPTSTVVVVNEARNISISSSKFSDTLAPMSVHVYEVLATVPSVPASSVRVVAKGDDTFSNRGTL